MNNNMEIQREAIIEIVGTQYEGRPVNHNPLFLQQGLMLKHQSDNQYDHNAVLLLTDDGKELGFLPKGYASLYAPAIDSGRYSFSVEIVKSEPDPERPILIVKITSELKNHSEEEIEADILSIVQNIVNGYAQRTTEYLTFIYSETVNVDELLTALNSARLIQKLHSCSSDLIESYDIKQNSEKYTPITKENLTPFLSNLKADVSDILKKIQKAYNESLDIDDEDEYHRVQSEIRERRKKFRSYDELLTSLLDTVTAYENVSIKLSSIPEQRDPEQTMAAMKENDTPTSKNLTISEPLQSAPKTVEREPETNLSDSPQLTEQAFFDWLISDGCVSESSAKQYISNIHSIEKLYQTIYGVKRSIIGANSSDTVGSMIESLIQRNEYIDANERRHNSFSNSLIKFIQFADISVDGLKSALEKKNYQPPSSTQPYVIKTVDFDNPQNCTYYKPCSFILNELQHSVESWRELYTKFLIQLYTDNAYSDSLKALSGKSLYGHRIDFADKPLSHYLRRPIRISANFFAEGNLSAIDIIKHIKHLMDICSIDDEHMIIEYTTQEKNIETVLPDDSENSDANGFQQLTIESIPEQQSSSTENKDTVAPDYPEIEPSITDEERITKDSFINWLTNVSGLADATAQSFYSSVTTSERIARKQNLKSQRLLSAQSYEEARETFNELLNCDTFVKMNISAHNSLTAGVRKLLSYIGAKENASNQENTTPESTSITTENTAATTPLPFTPDASKPFVLHDVIIEIMSSDAPEITKYHEHKGGFSSKSLCSLIKEYYGKSFSLFEISKILMLDRSFQSVGKGCYTLNKTMLSHEEAEPDNSEHNIPEKTVPVETETVPNQDDYPPVTPEAQWTDTESIQADGNTAEKMTAAPIEIETVPDQSDYPPVTPEVQRTDAEVIQANENATEDLTIESIIEVIKENSDNLQYEDGFGAYEIKTLLSHKGITTASEDQIEALMSECSELQEIEDGYYALSENDNEDNTHVELVSLIEDKPETMTSEATIPDTVPVEPQEISADSMHIVLRLNGNIIRAYDYSDALNKVCEFSINCKPFRMARIAGQAIRLNGNSVFYRKAVPVDGYNKLSNGLQIITINNLPDLQTITTAVQKYCHIDDDMITIISK